MHSDWHQGLNLSSDTINAIDLFTKRLQEALGNHLLSILIYGNFNADAHMASRSTSMLLMLDEVTIALLDKMRDLILAGKRDFQLDAMVLSEQDLLSSTDVFPIKYLDIQQHHRTIFGKDPFAGMTIAQDHLRLRCEQELKNLMVRLRRFYLHRSDYNDLIEATINNAAYVLFLNLKVMLFLKTGNMIDDTKKIMNQAVTTFGLDHSTLDHLLELRVGHHKPNREALKALYDQLMVCVQKAAMTVDKMA